MSSYAYDHQFPVKLGDYVCNIHDRVSYHYIKPLTNGNFTFDKEYCWSKSKENKERNWLCSTPVYNIKDWNKFKVKRLASQSNNDYIQKQNFNRFALFLNDEQVTSYSLEDDTYRIERKNTCPCQTKNDETNEDVVEIYNELKEFRNETMWNMLQTKHKEPENDTPSAEEEPESENGEELLCKQQ